MISTVFMMATKDNYWLTSDVSAINREKKDRLEWLMEDVSLVGVAISMIGGLGWSEEEAKAEKVADE